MMKRDWIAVAGTGLAILANPSAAAAQQWVLGSEIAGQSAQVTTNGVTNTVYFDQGGAARIVSPGGTMVNGTWAATNGQLCLSAGSATECWPYANSFQMGVPVTLVSSCRNSSIWVANNVNVAPPTPAREGERG